VKGLAYVAVYQNFTWLISFYDWEYHFALSDCLDVLRLNSVPLINKV
jgi:hypothetical protein